MNTARMAVPVALRLRRAALAAAGAVAILLATPPVHGTDGDANPSQSTADHRAFKQLQGPFAIEEVTKACLGCHNVAAKQLHKTTHWNWETVDRHTGQKLGKKNAINSFYLSVNSNIESCSACHIGFDWRDDEFDFTSDTGVDCLICHDTTGTYAAEKFHQSRARCAVCHDERPKRKKGDPIDLALVAQNVGPTSRMTCGACHIRDGGADGAKHGDLDSSLLEPSRSLDVHMDKSGPNFTCATCHNADQHATKTSPYLLINKDQDGLADVGGERVTCRSCHGDAPMKDDMLNNHTDRIACQTCHIPQFARGGVGTVVSWDWSTAGAPKSKGKILIKKDAANRVTYSARKGDLRWQENVVPEYVWSNGIVDHVLPGDKIDVDKVIPLNTYRGSADDPKARIFPVKVIRGHQPVDTGNKTLAIPHLLGRKRDAYWKGFEWKTALATGMEAAGLDFSGAFDFAETRTLHPINHMVAPAKDALACVDCHARNGRLANVEGVYVPGRDSYPIVEWLGAAFLAMTLFAGLVHGALRAVFRLARRVRS